MGKYSINDFQIGEKAHHLSNTTLVIIVIKVNSNPDEVTCRWVDNSGESHVEVFLPQELGKSKDITVGIYLG